MVEYYEHLCACGCGNKIKKIYRPPSRNIPIFIHGHNNRGKTGENAPGWKGGLTNDYEHMRKIRIRSRRKHQEKYNEWKRLKFIQDSDKKCIECGCYLSKYSASFNSVRCIRCAKIPFRRIQNFSYTRNELSSLHVYFSEYNIKLKDIPQDLLKSKILYNRLRLILKKRSST
jgi:hypothetical protein